MALTSGSGVYVPPPKNKPPISPHQGNPLVAGLLNMPQPVAQNLSNAFSGVPNYTPPSASMPQYAGQPAINSRVTGLVSAWRKPKQPIDEYYAAMGNLVRGGRPPDPTTLSRGDSLIFAAKLAAMMPLGPGPEIGAASKTPRALQLLGDAWRGIRGEGNAGRAASYPTGEAPASKYALSNLGEHAKFGPEVQRQREVMDSPSVLEHLAQIDRSQPGGFLKTPAEHEGGVRPEMGGQIPGALDTKLAREQNSLPFANELIRYSRRATETPADPGMLENASMIRNPHVPPARGKPQTLMPSEGTPEGLALRQMMNQYFDVGGSPLADRGAGMAKPLWQRGEGGPGDYLSGPRGAEHPDNEPFDFLQGGKPFERPQEGQDPTAPPFVPRQQKNQNMFDAARTAKGDQNQAAMEGPWYEANRLFGGAFGSRVINTQQGKLPGGVWGNDELLNSLYQSIMRGKNDSRGLPNSATSYGQDPQAWLADIMRRNIR